MNKWPNHPQGGLGCGRPGVGRRWLVGLHRSPVGRRRARHVSVMDGTVRRSDNKAAAVTQAVQELC